MKACTPLEFLSESADEENAALVLQSKDALPALEGVLKLLRTLRSCDLLRDEVLLSILSQASRVFDPLCVYAALRQYVDDWTFEPSECTAISVLAKVGNEPVALMRVDLLSDDVVFVARQNRKLVQVKAISADEIAAVLADPNVTSKNVWEWFNSSIQETIELGKKG